MNVNKTFATVLVTLSVTMLTAAAKAYIDVEKLKVRLETHVDILRDIREDLRDVKRDIKTILQEK